MIEWKPMLDAKGKQLDETWELWLCNPDTKDGRIIARVRPRRTMPRPSIPPRNGRPRRPAEPSRRLPGFEGIFKLGDNAHYFADSLNEIKMITEQYYKDFLEDTGLETILNRRWL